MAEPKVQDELDEPSIVERLVLEAEIAAERMIGWVRVALSLWLFAALAVSFLAIELFNMDLGTLRSIARQVGLGAQIAFLLVGLLALWVSTRSRWRPWMAYVFVTADALLIGLTMHGALRQTGLDGGFLFATPSFAAVPVMFCIGSLRPRPRVQFYATALHTALILLIAFGHGGIFEVVAGRNTANLPQFFELPSNTLRFALLIAAGLTVAFGAQRTRLLLKKSVRETHHRKALTRFLPAEVAPLVSSERFSTMRHGQRRVATVMFVDIRDSTARAETLDPQRLSVFISSFRRRVMRAAEANGGIVDKFIGDGALLLFGAREGSGEGATHALACARQLLGLIERWNTKRGFASPVRVGIGIHTGEVFLGVVGDERRLEFTVLGDSVNVAARLEQLTKVIGVPLLASDATVSLACEIDGWRLVQDEPLRGRSGAIRIFAPIDGPAWPCAAAVLDSAPG